MDGMDEMDGGYFHPLLRGSQHDGSLENSACDA